MQTYGWYCIALRGGLDHSEKKRELLFVYGLVDCVQGFSSSAEACKRGLELKCV